jgi:hypothetical protein
MDLGCGAKFHDVILVSTERNEKHGSFALFGIHMNIAVAVRINKI